MNRVLWLSDIHLNFLPPLGVERFLEHIAQQAPSAVLLSGDISEAPGLCGYLRKMSDRWDCPLYFVLGNHDYYFSSIREVREQVRELCKEKPRLIWLTESEPLELAQGVGLVGHDGWADARLGDYRRSMVMMNDYRLIAELAVMGKAERWPLLNRLGDEAAHRVREVLPRALERFEHVFFVTHIPPLKEACWHMGRSSDDEWLPHFTCLAIGETLLDISRERPDRRITVLCGHTHSPGECRPLENLQILTAQAEYGTATVQKTFEL